MGIRNKAKSSREGGSFVALPTVVLNSAAFISLSHPAKALLLEFALQNRDDNNGRLLCSMRHLRLRGWRSADVVTRAKRELLDAGFIYETVKGHRPNKASWYAVTWYGLARIHGYDHGAFSGFERGAYRKNQSLIPIAGAKPIAIAPRIGTDEASLSPPDGTVTTQINTASIPNDGNHLEMPSKWRYSAG